LVRIDKTWTVIAASADIMKKRTQDIRMLKHCEAIIDVCHMASDLVNDMVSFSKNSEDALGAININHEVLRCPHNRNRWVP